MLISIHAPREGSDLGAHRLSAGLGDFYPRSPRGERLKTSKRRQGMTHFYPRSPRGERHGLGGNKFGHVQHFYPRSPRGERPGGRPRAW